MCKYCEARENLCWGNKHRILIAELKDIDTDSPLNRFVIATEKCESIEINYCPMCGRKLTEEK